MRAAVRKKLTSGNSCLGIRQGLGTDYNVKSRIDIRTTAQNTSVLTVRFTSTAIPLSGRCAVQRGTSQRQVSEPVSFAEYAIKPLLADPLSGAAKVAQTFPYTKRSV